MSPAAQRVTLVQDHLSAHKKSALYDLFEPTGVRAILDKVEFAFSPKHGSWLNVAESELSVLTRQGLELRVKSRKELETQVKA